jgi:hypothetical protein
LHEEVQANEGILDDEQIDEDIANYEIRDEFDTEEEL